MKCEHCGDITLGVASTACAGLAMKKKRKAAQAAR